MKLASLLLLAACALAALVSPAAAASSCGDAAHDHSAKAAPAASKPYYEETTPLDAFGAPLEAFKKVRLNLTSTMALDGYRDREVNVFRGIPYAQPPTGARRYRNPVPHEGWEGVRSGFRDGPICPQFHLSKKIFLGDEDCLTLTVSAPHKRAEPLLPVLVWIYGGAWVLGDSEEFGVYNAANLAAQQGVVVVAMNYRLGALGFLAVESMAGEGEDKDSLGSWALKDQRLALQWVQRHISAFGGDPARVTIMGESAGAFSVCWHLASRASRGLFRAAIMESGTCDSQFFFTPRANVTAWGDTYAKSLGCDKATTADVPACLRALPASALVAPPALRGFAESVDSALASPALGPRAAPGSAVFPLYDYATRMAGAGSVAAADAVVTPPAAAEALSAAHAAASGAGVFAAGDYVPALYPLMPWAATIDGSAEHGLTASPLETMRAGRGADVPLIIGSNKDEGSLFVPAVPLMVEGVKLPLTEAGIRKVLAHFFGARVPADDILAQYPAKQFASGCARMAAILRDYIFACPSRRAADARRAAMDGGAYLNSDSFLYEFTYTPAFLESLLLGTYHASELAFVFNNQWPPVLHWFNAKDKLIAHAFNTFWAGMFRGANPNLYGNATKPLSVQWPVWTGSAAGGALVDINLPLKVRAGKHDQQCAFWDKHVL